MFTAFLGLPPILMLAYILLWILSIWFLLVFIRYSYIALFYRNKFYYLGYKSAILWLKNFGKALKENVFNEEKKLDIKEKIGIIKMKMKELVIKQEVDGIENTISSLNEVIEKIKDIKKNDLLNLEDQTMNSISDKLRSITWSSDINEVKGIIEDISWHIDELKNTLWNLDIASIYIDISKELGIHTNEYVLKRDSVMQEIQELEKNISDCDKSLKLLEDSKMEVENNNIKSAMKESKDGDSLVQSISKDFENLWDSILIIVKLTFAFALLLGDIILSYKLFSAFYAVEISSNKVIFLDYTYSTVVTVLSFFLPILFFFMFELILKGAKDGKILGKILKALMLILTWLCVLWGLIVFIGSRILTNLTNPTDIMMALFFIPATVVLAYIVHKVIEEHDKKIMYLFCLPFFLTSKCLSYLPYISWKQWQKWIKQNNHKKTLNKQISEIQSKKNTILKEVSDRESLISSMQDHRDKKILEEVKTQINIDGNIQNIDKSLIWMTGINDTVWTAITFADTMEKSFNTIFNKIKKARDTDIKKTERKIERLKKNISDIEEWFEYAMKKYLVIN